ncbi:ParB-like nuclease domain-containing protein [Candidatus Woesearchaeota archaeon]|nr:ParB-like nuclease domain-containing protein [Candidatus Woesearchaeota archaeon]
MKVVPKIIKEVGFDFHWNVEKVWALNYPAEEIDIRELEWHFEIPFWSKKGGFYDLSPNDVISKPELFKEEYERTMNANLAHPIDIMKNKGKWLILDGLHRLVKAKIIGAKKVKVRKIPRSEIPNIEKKALNS